MKANAVSILAIFEKKLRLEVSLFQRQYVWNQERQWEPLWEDISRKFTEYMGGRKDAPVHFLGAIVLVNSGDAILNCLGFIKNDDINSVALWLFKRAKD